MIITIRKAVPGEEYDINRVIIRTWKTSYRGVIDDEYLDSLSESDTSRLDRMRGSIEKGCVYLALVGGEVVGAALFGEAMTEYDGADIEERGSKGELYALYVLPEHQRSGAGRRLVGAVKGELFLKGYRKMLIGCLTDNPSCRFYEKEGGRLIGTTQHAVGGKAYAESVYEFDI
jgi:GNAT superfamily N-acetyltransferase